MTSGLARALAITVGFAALTLGPTASAADPFVQRAARQMEQQDRPASSDERDDSASSDEADRSRDDRRMTVQERRAAAREKLEAQREAQRIARAEEELAKLDPKLRQARQLLDAHRYMEAARLLQRTAKDIAPLHDPQLQAMLGQLALIDDKPDKALSFVEPVLPEADGNGIIDPRGLDEQAARPLRQAMIVAGRAYNERAVAEALIGIREEQAQRKRDARQRGRNKEEGNTFFGIPVDPGSSAPGSDKDTSSGGDATSGGGPRSVEELADRLAPRLYLPDLDYLGVAIDAQSEKPALSTRAAEHADQALRLFDHLAGHTEGETQLEAAWRCGRSLALLGRYDEALDAFGFAHHLLRQMHSSDPPEGIKPIADGLREDRKRVAYLRDVTRYGLEYLLYREAQQHRLAGRYEQAAAAYRECIDASQDTMTRLLIEKLSTEFKLPEDKEPEEAIDESPYTAASRLYEALCLIEMGEQREGVAKLESFMKDSDPDQPGLYRGEAMLQLARLYLDGRAGRIDQEKAGDWLARLDKWIELARDDNEAWAFSELLPGIRKAAKARTDGPDKEKTRDMWGNVVESRIDPGMLVNRKTTPWYLNDLEENGAKLQGFLFLADGDGDKALEQFRRITKLDSFAKDGERGIDPNDFTRLKFGADHGYLIAYPKEQAPFNDKLRYVILLADLHYASSDFDEARQIYEAMLKGRYGNLTDAQKDYPRFAAGLCHFRSRETDKAAARWEQVIEQMDGTYTEFRAAYAIGHLSRYAANPDLRERGQALLLDLARSNADNSFTRKARITVAMDLAKAGEIDKAMNFLHRVDDADSSTHQLAAYLIKTNGEVRLPGPNPPQKKRKNNDPLAKRDQIPLRELSEADSGSDKSSGSQAGSKIGADQQEESKDDDEPTFFGI